MTYFESFDSLEDAFAKMREREEAANARLLPIQEEVTWGSKFLRIWTVAGPNEPLFIFGEVWTKAQVVESERGDPFTIRRLEDTHARGYRFGRCYSVVVPEGELGETHIADVIGPLTDEQFERARLFGWQVEPISHEPWFKATLATYLAQWLEANPSGS